MIEKMRMESIDLTSQNMEKIAEMFPNCVTESKKVDGTIKKAINFDLLKQMLSKEILEGNEAYEFTWVGKKAAIVEANKPTRKTLRPCPKESVNWDTTENLYIKGDNLETLKLMQESYLGKVKMIYIDPPYNTGKDCFVYPDNFVMDEYEYKSGIGLNNEDGNKLFKENSSKNPRFHSMWCSMIYQRLLLARNLLSDDGVILVSIGDRELKNLQSMMDEVFGASNEVCCFVWKSRAKPTNAGNSRFRPQKVSEYILVYSKKKPDDLIFNVIPAKERSYPNEDELGRFRTTTILTSNRGTFRRETMRFESHGYTPSEDYRWKAGKETIDRLYDTNHMYVNDDGVPMEKKYAHEESDPLYPIYTFIDPDLSGTAESGKTELSSLVGKYHGFDTVKPVQLMKYLIQTFSGKEDIVMDFFSGSATTAQACIEQNIEDGGHRKFILMQIEEKCDPSGEAYANGFNTICDIAIKRINAVRERAHISGETSSDIGFRIFKVAESNMNNVYYSAGEYTQDLLMAMESNIKADRTDLDLLFGCLLEWGLPLSMPYTSEEINGFTVHTYNNGDLVACFDEGLTTDVIMAIAKKKPLRVVFRDVCFTGSPDKINLNERFKLISPDTSIKVI